MSFPLPSPKGDPYGFPRNTGGGTDVKAILWVSGESIIWVSGEDIEWLA